MHAITQRFRPSWNGTLLKKLLLDLAMTILILLEFAYQLTGNTVHELIGISMFALFVVHGKLNWQWFLTLLKGKYRGIRIASVVANLLLLATALTMITSGMLSSRVLSSLFNIEFDLIPREVHTVAAYWFLILMAVHLGMHWELIMAEVKTLTGISSQSHLRKITLRLISAIIVAYGIYASFERSIFSRLTAHYSFDFWDFDVSVIGFFIQYVSIVGLYAWLAHCAMHRLKCFSVLCREMMPHDSSPKR